MCAELASGVQEFTRQRGMRGDSLNCVAFFSNRLLENGTHSPVIPSTLAATLTHSLAQEHWVLRLEEIAGQIRYADQECVGDRSDAKYLTLESLCVRIAG